MSVGLPLFVFGSISIGLSVYFSKGEKDMLLDSFMMKFFIGCMIFGAVLMGF